MQYGVKILQDRQVFVLMENKDCPIIDGDCSRFVTLPQERILVAKREYWLLACIPILFTVTFSFLLIAFGFIIFLMIFHSIVVFVASTLVIVNAAMAIGAKIYIHWYFHMYIITTRKLLEVNYSPLDTLVENEVLLDQVRCTEVDMQRGGLIHELLDFGTIRVTFDRPTHQQEFVLANIKSHRKIGILLSNMLVDFETADFVNPLRYYNNSIRRIN